MATPDVMQADKNFHFIDHPKGENVKPREMTIEKKIDLLEGLTGNVSNRRTRRWINDRLLMELVPRLNAEEIRGLFAPPPWGDEAKFKSRAVTIMALFFSLTTPIGICIGLGITNTYDENSTTALIVEGSFDAASAGILIYMALVDLLAVDFMSPKLQNNARLHLGANVSLLLGAGCMSLIAKWA